MSFLNLFQDFDFLNESHQRFSFSVYNALIIISNNPANCNLLLAMWQYWRRLLSQIAHNLRSRSLLIDFRRAFCLINWGNLCHPQAEVIKRSTKDMHTHSQFPWMIPFIELHEREGWRERKWKGHNYEFI